jgi:hypothetical protein
MPSKIIGRKVGFHLTQAIHNILTPGLMYSHYKILNVLIENIRGHEGVTIPK